MSKLGRTILQKIRFGQASESQPFDCQNQDSEWWHERARQAVNLWREALSKDAVTKQKLRIADFGCGDQKLKLVLTNALGTACEYFGYDLNPQSAEIESCDLEESPPTGPFDVIFCLGLFEYIRNLDLLLSRMHHACSYAVISFVTMKGGECSPEEMRKRGWVSQCSSGDLSEKLKAAGFTIRKQILINDDTTALWLLQAESPGVRDV